MNATEKSLKNKAAYSKLFRSWIASETIIDDKKALYILKAPNSDVRKVCMYRDGSNAFFYGDYGQFSFDSLTWLATPDNLEYNNLPYLMEKLNCESKESLRVYEPEYAISDILDWAKERLEDRLELPDSQIRTIMKYLKNGEDGICDAYDFAQSHPKICENTDVENFIALTESLIYHTDDEYQFITELNNSWNELEQFDEACECNLWHAGKRIHQRFFVCLYAMQICAGKLARKRAK